MKKIGIMTDSHSGILTEESLLFIMNSIMELPYKHLLSVIISENKGIMLISLITDAILW